MILALAEILAGETTAQVLALIQRIGGGTPGPYLGLSTGTWPPQGMLQTVWSLASGAIQARVTAVSDIAAGGFGALSAGLVNSDGTENTFWLDLWGQSVMQTTRIQATAATGPVGFLNTGASISYPAGQFHLTDSASGATYSNEFTINITGGGATTTHTFVADQTGAAGTSAAGTVLVLSTPVIGLSVLPLGGNGLVGSDQETNSAYLRRCYAKPASLSPNGPPQAYYYQATTTIPPSGAPINRCKVIAQKYSAVVSVLVANANGTPSQADVAAITSACLFACPLPAGVQAIPATTVSVPIGSQFQPCDIAIPSTLIGLVDQDAVIQAGEDAVAQYASTCPIGGVRGVFPVSGQIAAIINGVVAEVVSEGFSLTADQVFLINAPTTDTPLASTQIPTVQPTLAIAGA